MPELPEVEATRRAIAGELTGNRVSLVEVGRDRMLRRQERPGDFAERLSGRRIERWRRHGKFLIADLEGDVAWVTHLGMSGRVQLAGPAEARVAHTNVVVATEGGTDFRLVDPRTFGFVAAYLPDELAASPVGRLGPDALDALPSARQLGVLLRGRSVPIKPALLDQRIVSGIGNIYADEALSRAAISPHRPAGSLETAELSRLRRSIADTLQMGLRWGGTSLDDLAYLLPDGATGDYTRRLRAYGREGKPCRRCGLPIRRDVLRQRSTFWCEGCQR